MVVLILFVAQVAIGVAVSLVYDVPVSWSLWYAIVLPVVHIGLGSALAALHKLFLNTDTGEHLSRVNIANVLSMIRVSSSPTLLWLVLIASEYPVVPVLVPLAALVFLTDLLDGQISRRTHQTTRIGRYLDSTSDYTVLFIVAVALVAYQLISLWLFVVLMLRFGLQVVGQVVLFVAQKWKIDFRTSFLGKASVFTVMTVFALALLGLLDVLPQWYTTLLTAAEYVTGAIAVVSLAEKVFLFTVDARNVPERKRS